MGLTDQLRFAGSIGRVTGTVAGERLRPRGPVTDGSIVPASVRELTPQWLTAALCKGVPGAAVTDFALGEGSDGTSSRRAITVHYNAAGAAAGLPTAVYSKSTPSLVNRLLLGVTEAAGAEALFYESIRGDLDIGAPAGYHGAWDPKTCRSMVLTEDIAVTRQARFGSATIHVDRPAAESMVREMASYHGALWEDPRLDREWTSLRSAFGWQENFNRKAGVAAGGVLAFRLAQDEIPPELHARKGEVRSALMRSLALNGELPQTLLHQDVHPGNWFRLPDGSLRLYDWQSVAKGNWALDVAYALSAGLDIEDRRAWERELLELYLDELGSWGGRPPAFEDAWLAYRRQMFHGLIFWTYTHTVGQVATLQPEEHVRLLIRRTAQAVVDLGSLGTVGA